MVSFGLTFGHVATNMGDLALNVGVRRLVETVSNPTVKICLLKPNAGHLERAKPTLGPSGTEIVSLDESMLATEKLLEYCAEPEAFLVDANLADVDVIMTHSGEHLFAPRRPENPDTLWRILPGLAAKAAGKKSIVLPSTFGPFDDQHLSRAIGHLLSSADAAAGRESASVALVEEAFDLRLPALLDPAFLIATGDRPAVRETGRLIRIGMALRIEEFGLRAGIVASRERSARFRESGYRESMAFALATGVMERLYPAVDGEVSLFVQTIADQHLQTAIAAEGGKLMRSEGRIKVVAGESVESYLEALAGLDMLISARFHGCILALLGGVPAVGVHMASHGHKMPGLFALLGVPDYCLTVAPENAHEAGRQIPMLFGRRTLSFQNVWSRIAELELRTRDWFQQAVESPTINSTTDAHEGLRALEEAAMRFEWASS